MDLNNVRQKLTADLVAETKAMEVTTSAAAYTAPGMDRITNKGAYLCHQDKLKQLKEAMAKERAKREAFM
jgi:hypothetical protein